MMRRGCDVVAESISRQSQTVDSIHYFVRIKPSIRIIRVFFVEVKLRRFGDAIRKVEPLARVESQVLPPCRLIELCIVFLDEATGSAD